MQTHTFHQKQIFFRIKILLAVVLCYYLTTWKTGCPIRFLTGISCPGCGMTRAWLAFLGGHIWQAFSCHPLFLAAPLVGAAFIWEEFFARPFWRRALLILCLCFLLVYLIRMIWFPSPIMVFAPKEGFLYRNISSLWHYFFAASSGAC